MFGRRRRAAPVIQVAAPELSDEQVFELLHSKLAEIIGATGQWTLVARSDDDTDVIFHGLKAKQIATTLTSILSTEKAELRGERAAEPTALSWTPAPISVWAEPVRDEPARAVTAADEIPSLPAYAEQTRLVA